MTTLQAITTEHLGTAADEGDVVLFVAACKIYMATAGCTEEEAAAYVYGDGDFKARQSALLRSQVDLCIVCGKPLPEGVRWGEFFSHAACTAR